VQQTQKIESLQVLAGGIAHDFNNLLMIITGNADLGLMDVAPDSPVGELLQEIKGAAVRASKLSNQMRAYSGQGHVGMEQVILNDIVAEMLRLMKSSIPPQIQLEYDFATHLPTVQADVSQLEQVVMNLIVNAYESIGPGAGTICVRTGAVDVTRDYLAQAHAEEDLPGGQYVFLEVQDTGCGMDEQTRERIFDPFFTTKFIGRGLGLAAVLGILRGHRGAIHVTSSPGQGSTFQVLLPPAKVNPLPDHTQKQPAHDDIRQWKGQGTVLVIDDEKSFLNIASIVLRRSGFEVVPAETGQAALDYFRENYHQVVAVLLDMSMPGMSGEETFTGLKQIDPQAKIFLCSGFGESDAVKRFSGEGLAGFLQKPFQIDTLLMTLRKAIDGE
jgi:CheY-like chemotaxis protein